MRVSFKLLLALIIFHAVFALYTPVFGTSQEGAIAADEDNPVAMFNIANFKVGNILDFIFDNAMALTGVTVLTAIGVIAAIKSGNMAFIGAGIFIGILAWSYNEFISFILQLGTEATGSNTYVTGMMTILSIVIGIIIMYNIIDMFAPHPVQ